MERKRAVFETALTFAATIVTIISVAIVLVGTVTITLDMTQAHYPSLEDFFEVKVSAPKVPS